MDEAEAEELRMLRKIAVNRAAAKLMYLYDVADEWIAHLEEKGGHYLDGIPGELMDAVEQVARSMDLECSDRRPRHLIKERETVMTKKFQGRQGDVLIVAEEIPSDAVPVEVTDPRGIVLSEGEATGHYHGINDRMALLFQSTQMDPFIRAKAPVALRHQRHEEIPLKEGNYRSIQQQAYIRGSVRNAVD